MEEAAAPATGKLAPRRDPFWPRVGLIAIFCCIYLAALPKPALLDDADATHAEAAREMAATGDYVTLHVNGVRYLEKAALPYWLAALGIKIFHPSAAAVHWPQAAGVLALALLGAAWARRAFGRRAGNYAALFTLTTTGVFLFTRIMIPEVLLSAFIAASLYCFLTALDGSAGRGRWYWGYAFVALGVMTKGLVALVFVGGAAAIYLAMSGEWRRWREFHLLGGLAVLVAIAAPWHILAGIRNHGFLWFYFVNEHFLRFLGRRYPRDYNKLPAAAFWLLHLAWLFPWSLFLPAVALDGWQAWRQRRLRKNEATPPALDFARRTRLLCAAWAALVLAFFAVSTNQEYYTFPAYFPLVLLLAASVAADENEGASGRARWLAGAHVALAVIGVVVAALLGSGLWQSRQLPFEPDIGRVLAERGVGQYTLSMSHFFDLTTASFAALRLPAALAMVVFGLGPLVALGLRLRKKHYAATWAVGLTMAAFLVAAHIALERFGPYLSSRALADAVQAEEQPADQVAIYGDFAYGSSFAFYLQRQVLLVNGRSTSLLYGSTYPDAPRVFLDDDDLQRLWAGPGRVFLFVTADRVPEVEALLPQARTFAESSGKRVLTNR